MRYNDLTTNVPTPLNRKRQCGSVLSGRQFYVCDVTHTKVWDQTGDVGIDVGGLRAELRRQLRGDRRGGGASAVGAVRDVDAGVTAFPFPFFREGGGGSVMISARGQFHSGGGPPSGGNVVAGGAGADRWGIWEVEATTAALSLRALVLADGPSPVAPHTAWMCSG